MADPKLEEAFRNTLRGLIALCDAAGEAFGNLNDLAEVCQDMSASAERFRGVCQSPGDFAGMARLALENDGQLRLMLQTMQGKK